MRFLACHCRVRSLLPPCHYLIQSVQIQTNGEFFSHLMRPPNDRVSLRYSTMTRIAVKYNDPNGFFPRQRSLLWPNA